MACLCLGALALVACDDKKAATDKPAASATASAAASAAPKPATPSATVTASASAAPAAAKSLAERLKCDALLPETPRNAAGLLNYKLTQQATCPECGPTCSMVKPDKPFEGVAVSYTCNAPYEKASADKQIDELKKALKKPVAVTLGRGGVMGEKDAGAFYSATAFDDDSDCKIVVDWMRGDKKLVEPLLKLALASVKQADLAAAKK
jgi:hypothetical protein